MLSGVQGKRKVEYGSRAARRTVSAYGRINTAVYEIAVTTTRTVKCDAGHLYGTVRVVLRYFSAVPAVLSVFRTNSRQFFVIDKQCGYVFSRYEAHAPTIQDTSQLFKYEAHAPT